MALVLGRGRGRRARAASDSRSTCASTGQSSDGSQQGGQLEGIDLRRRRRAAPAGHRQGLGPVRATAASTAMPPIVRLYHLVHRLDRHRARPTSSRLVAIRRGRALGTGRRMPMTPEQIHQRRWMHARRLVPLARGHQRRQHDPQRGAAVDRARASAPRGRSCSGSSTPTRSCSPACCSRPGRSATSFGRKRRSPSASCLFGTFSALASRSTSAEMLIVARGLMGIGGALHLPDARCRS